MTDEKMIAVLRRFHEAFNRGDVEAVVQLVRPDFELVRQGGQSSIKGVAALREWMEPDALEEQNALSCSISGLRATRSSNAHT